MIGRRLIDEILSHPIAEGERPMKTDDQLAPTVFVIFGGAGDLTWRKLLPKVKK